MTQEYEYVPFPVENAEWKSDEWSGFCDPPIYYCGSHTYSTGDEVVINDTIYIGIYSGPLSGPIGLRAAMRVQEDSTAHKVFIRSVNHPYNEVVLYDFDLSVGDTLPFVDWDSYQGSGNQVEAIIGYRLTIGAIDSIELNNDGRLRRRFHLLLEETVWVDMKIIEGIGATAGLGVGIDFSEFEHSYQLQCLMHNGVFEFGYQLSEAQVEYNEQYGYVYCAPPVGITEKDRQVSLFYPNPMVNNTLNYQGKKTLKSVTVFDMQGREISVKHRGNTIYLPSQARRGIYLIKGILDNDITINQRIIKP